MKIVAILWTLIAAYFAVLAAIYVVLSGDPAGTSVLLVGSALGGLIAGWLWHWGRSHEAPASDHADTTPADEMGLIGVYPTDSIRPFAMAVAFTGLWVGLVAGIWLTGMSLALLASQVALMVRDGDR